jgi:hypothetical protein
MMDNHYTEDDMGEWRRWDDDLVAQCEREVRFLVKVLASLVLAALILVLMKIF